MEEAKGKLRKYAEIIVDIPLKKLDHSFHYAIPGRYQDKIEIGWAVLVPFGKRKVHGFVIGFTNQPEVDESKIKSIIKPLIEDSFFDIEMLKLLKWIASYYKSYLIQVIKTAVPTGVIDGRVNKKSIKYVKLKQPDDIIYNFIDKKGKKAFKQALVLKILLADKNEFYTSTELANMAETSTNTISKLIDKGLLKYIEKVKNRRPFLNSESNLEIAPEPTVGQQDIIKKINNQVKINTNRVFLLHGITGSGKTEVYLQVIKNALNKNKGAIVLVPEISLTPMMVKRFYSRFGDRIAVLHSNLSLGERYDEWRRLKNGNAQIAIGARSAIFAPISDLGLIIIDEEHENSYKQGKNPYYHAREVALKRGKICQIPVLLGSATPSLESYYFAKKEVFNYTSLTKRITGKRLPPVKIIDMKQELKKGNTTIFSNILQETIKKALAHDEQVLIFLNRRGYANFILCRECGNVIKCKNCDITLTYHAGIKKLKCHYCEYTQEVPEICPTCRSNYLREFGIGTERLEEELKNLFPGADIDRMDVDTTGRKGSHHHILKKLESGQTDILVGTQMIAKGHDYPNISVVGVISADTILNIPDFRSAERTFQLLTQVAGRTGRGKKIGQVIIQTYNPEHYSIKATRHHDYEKFYEKEIKNRKNYLYPPFTQLVNIIIKGKDEEKVRKGATGLENYLNNYRHYYLEILGPSPAPIHRIQNNYRWQIIIKFKGYKKRNFVLSQIMDNFIDNDNSNVIYNIDVDPLKML